MWVLVGTVVHCWSAAAAVALQKEDKSNIMKSYSIVFLFVFEGSQLSRSLFGFHLSSLCVWNLCLSLRTCVTFFCLQCTYYVVCDSLDRFVYPPTVLRLAFLQNFQCTEMLSVE